MSGLRTLAAAVALALLPLAAHAQDWRTVTQMRQASPGDDVFRVLVQYGAGTLALSPGSSGLLYRASLRYDADAFQPDLSYQPGLLHLGLSDVRVRGRNVKGGELRLALGTGTPYDLQLEFGAAKADIDLSGLRIRRFALHTGASETIMRLDRRNQEVCESADLDVGAAKFEAQGLGNLNAKTLDFSGGIGDVTLDFTGEWQQNLNATVHMGLGSLTLRVPRGVGLQVRKNGLLVGFDSEGLVKRGDVYSSVDWERADHKLAIDIEAAFGSIRVMWVDANQI